MLDKLNTNEDIYKVLPDVLTELCEYLQFGCGFFYQANYEKQFTVKEARSIYPNYILPDTINFADVLVEAELQELYNKDFIFYRSGSIDKQNNLGSKITEIFNAKSIIIDSIFDENNELIGFVGVSDRRGLARTEDDDVTLAYTTISTICNYLKLQIMKEKLDATQKALQSVTDNMGVDIYVNDFYTHEVLYANSSMAAPYGGVDNMVGKICWDVLYDDKTGQCEYCPQKKIIDDEGKPTKIYTWDYQRPFDKSWFKVLSTACEWIDGRLAHIVSSIDITESKKNEQIIQRMARFDHLTGLPNRYRLTEDLDMMIPTMESKNEEGYVIFFDLDGFKAINDRHGHQVGDELLVRIGELLQGNEYINDKCYRYGGDEFVILCYDNNVSALNYILSFLETIFTKPIVIDGKFMDCGASIGVSHYPHDDKITSELVRKADQAMYVSKDTDKNMIHFFNKGDVCPKNEYYNQRTDVVNSNA